MKESDRFPSDDITWCMAECKTDCPRQPKYIRDKTIPHSFADFSKNCMAYVPKGASDEQTHKRIPEACKACAITECEGCENLWEKTALGTIRCSSDGRG